MGPHKPCSVVCFKMTYSKRKKLSHVRLIQNSSLISEFANTDGKNLASLSLKKYAFMYQGTHYIIRIITNASVGYEQDSF